MIYLFCGKGKGKTSSAVGMGVRAAGAGKKVLMIQFLKTKKGSSENVALEKVEGFGVASFGREGFFLPQKILDENPAFKDKAEPLSKRDFKLAEEGFKLAKESAESGEVDLLILDEINLAMSFGLLEQNEVLRFLENARSSLDIVLTGRGCSARMIEAADLVTRLKEVKHYFNKGVGAQKGREY